MQLPLLMLLVVKVGAMMVDARHAHSRAATTLGASGLGSCNILVCGSCSYSFRLWGSGGWGWLDGYG